MSGSVRLRCQTCGEYKLWKESDYDWQGSRGSNADASTAVRKFMDGIAESQAGKSTGQRQTSTMIASEPSTPGSSATIDYRTHSRRKHERVSLQMSLRIRANTSAARFSEVSKSINVSRTGIFFRSTFPYQPGLKVFVTLSYSPESPNPPIEHTAVVIRVDSQKENGSQGVALMLV